MSQKDRKSRQHRLVVLDRDGVINQDSDNFIKHPREWEPLPGSGEAIARLTAHGYTVVIATNQSGLGRGLFDRPMLERIHQKLIAHVEAAGGAIGGIFFCPHHPDELCDCRKPKTGLLDQIARLYGQALTGVPCIGDSRRDLEAAWSVGARAILVRTGNGANTEAGLAAEDAVEVFDDLGAVADALIRELS